LCVGEVLVKQERDIEISNFGNVSFPKEDVGRFNIPVDNIFGMKNGNSIKNVSANGPYLRLIKTLMINNFVSDGGG
jgi:hypothetical protein